MIDFSFANFAKLVLAFLLAFLQSEAAAAHSAMVTVGDEIDGMTLTTGAADARPLWVFCATAVNKNVTTAHCQVSEISRLAIGNAFLGANSVFHKAEWSQLKWELYLDDLYIDLDEFGTYDYVQPSLASHPARVREVFMKFTA